LNGNEPLTKKGVEGEGGGFFGTASVVLVSSKRTFKFAAFVVPCPSFVFVIRFIVAIGEIIPSLSYSTIFHPEERLQ
jgi:hypothetical protein